MPRRFTMSALVTRCKQRCDQENSSHIGDPEWKGLISTAYSELWSSVTDPGSRYFETSTTITADGSASYDEPADHMSTIQVVYVDASGGEDPLDELEAVEEWRFKGMTGRAGYWALVDDQLYLYPTPSSGTYKWYYVPQPTDLSAYGDDDVVDVACGAGERFLIAAVAAMALDKSESQVARAVAERDRARDDLMFWASQRSFRGRRRVVESDPDLGNYDPADWRWRQ